MKPCRRGHDRNNGGSYAYTDPFTGRRNVVCKQCQKDNYERNKVKYNARRCQIWREKGY